jgi:hypothetical protein
MLFRGAPFQAAAWRARSFLLRHLPGLRTRALTMTMRLINEFAAVEITRDDHGNGPRLMIRDLQTGQEAYLDPLELAALAWIRHEELLHCSTREGSTNYWNISRSERCASERRNGPANRLPAPYSPGRRKTPLVPHCLLTIAHSEQRAVRSRPGATNHEASRLQTLCRIRRNVGCDRCHSRPIGVALHRVTADGARHAR